MHAANSMPKTLLPHAAFAAYFYLYCYDKRISKETLCFLNEKPPR